MWAFALAVLLLSLYVCTCVAIFVWKCTWRECVWWCSRLSISYLYSITRASHAVVRRELVVTSSVFVDYYYRVCFRMCCLVLVVLLNRLHSPHSDDGAVPSSRLGALSTAYRLVIRVDRRGLLIKVGPPCDMLGGRDVFGGIGICIFLLGGPPQSE